jgi:hypothetical protein
MILEFVAALALGAAPIDEATAREASPPPAVRSVAPAWTPIQFNNSTARATAPRWGREICIGAAGLGPEQTQFIVDRMSQRAVALGLTPERPGCDANVFVFFTTNPNQVAADVLASRDFSGRGRARTADLQRRDAFANTRNPIRWWYVWQSVTADGQIVNPDERSGQAVSVRAPERGRLGRNTRQQFSHVFVVVDGTQVANTNMNAVADYAAMVALAEFEPDANIEGDASILRLFTDSTPPVAMTSWDLEYLRAYYRAPE